MIDIVPLALSIIEAAHLAGISRSAIYLAIGRGELTVRKSGRRSLILRDDLTSWLQRLPTATPANKAA